MPHPIYKQIGALLRQRRKELDLIQHYVARRLGISRGSLANIETGRQSILVHQLYRFAEILQLSPSDLLPPDAPKMPIQQDWSAKMPADLKPQHQEQIARLLEGTKVNTTTQKRENNAKRSTR